jgi:hypothetical protein
MFTDPKLWEIVNRLKRKFKIRIFDIYLIPKEWINFTRQKLHSKLKQKLLVLCNTLFGDSNLVSEFSYFYLTLFSSSQNYPIKNNKKIIMFFSLLFFSLVSSPNGLFEGSEIHTNNKNLIDLVRSLERKKQF